MNPAVRYIPVLTVAVLLVLATGARAQDDEPLPGKVRTRDGAVMALIPGGPFMMGSPAGDGLDTEFPQHEVHVDPFYMDTTEVTNGRYAAFLNEIRAPEGKEGQIWTWVVLRSDLEYPERAQWWPTEISFKRGKFVPSPGWEDHPLITISWRGAKAFCEYYGKRLPFEAEWEKAARGGLKGKQFPWGDAYPTGGATFDRRWPSNLDPVPTTAVGSYAPNNFGLYDMAGNVWEWCQDGYDPQYYRNSPGKNPPGTNNPQQKVLRGGSWFNPVQFLRVAQRNFGHVDGTEDAIGFRCAMEASPATMQTAGAAALGEADSSSAKGKGSEGDTERNEAPGEGEGGAAPAGKDLQKPQG